MKPMHCIPKAELVDGAYYVGQCRNATLARWCANREEFVHWRTKFGNRYLECIKHPDDEQHYDVFYAQMVCTDPALEIPLN